jgi:hypothetical protein
VKKREKKVGGGGRGRRWQKVKNEITHYLGKAADDGSAVVPSECGLQNLCEEGRNHQPYFLAGRRVSRHVWNIRIAGVPE